MVSNNYNNQTRAHFEQLYKFKRPMPICFLTHVKNLFVLHGSQPHPRNKVPVPGIYPIGADEHIDFVDDEYDDIVLPEMAHCAGPACIMAAIPGEKYCSESCRLKHISSRGSIRPGVTNSRSGMNSLASREVNAIP
ncbi:unnamed protein product [Trichobilharzia regenti]|nr:unnamed protein product [Trichobilharzia regenti]